MSSPNDANLFWTYDFDNAYFNNDDEMHYGDNEFDEDYSDLDEEQFNGSYDWDDPFFNCEVEMHEFCNDLGHSCLNLDHDTIHCEDDTDYDCWFDELFHIWETVDLGEGASQNSDGRSVGASSSTTT
nr:hypothetical protein CFP56_71162 [Quercus suber]